MATESVSIKLPVGTRNGTTPLPNTGQDLDVITDLLDRVPGRNGGTADVPGTWPKERTALIAEVTARISAFQSANGFPKPDSAVDPGGRTLHLLNQFAVDPPLAAKVDPRPEQRGLEFVQDLVNFASVASMPGGRPLQPDYRTVAYERRLIQVTGSSIKWFGVVLPTGVGSTVSDAVPLLFYTPTPIQGNYHDTTYDSFDGWGQLWFDYTSRIGGLLAAAAVKQILVIPFYKTSQAYGLGSFLKNWQEVVAAVITTAVNDINPYYLTSPYTFKRIYTASFSNGINVHQAFNSHGTNAKTMTTLVFDLDGQAQTGGSNWRPPNGIIYHNRAPPGGVNPHGNNWYVGGRWELFDKIEPTTSKYSHHACSQYLLYHGLAQYCA